MKKTSFILSVLTAGCLGFCVFISGCTTTLTSGNKKNTTADNSSAVEAAEKIRAAEPETVVIPVSVHTGRGMKDAQNQIVQLVNRQEQRLVKEENGTAEFGSGFMKDRAGFDDDDDENIQYPGSEQ